MLAYFYCRSRVFENFTPHFLKMTLCDLGTFRTKPFIVLSYSLIPLVRKDRYKELSQDEFFKIVIFLNKKIILRAFSPNTK